MTSAPCVTRLLLAALLAILAVSTANALDYSYGMNTPMGGISANRQVATAGQDFGGVDYDCAALITRLSADLRANAHNPGAVRAYMNRPVIGVALVDYGTAAAPNVQGYLSRSGNVPSNAATEAAALAYVAANAATATNQGANLLVVGGGVATNWKFINDQAPLSEYALGGAVVGQPNLNQVVDLPHVVNFGAHNTFEQDRDAWTPIAGGTPRDIYFSVYRGFHFDTVVKKWPIATAPGTWHVETSTNSEGTCALQKLMFKLHGLAGPLDPLPAGPARPFLTPDAHHAQAAENRPKLVCVAEAAHSISIPVFDWAPPGNAATPYGASALVPSCAVCQAIVPAVLEGTLNANSALQCAGMDVYNTVGGAAVPNGHANTCVNNVDLNHGQSCTITCDGNRAPHPARTMCAFGRVFPQTCRDTCAVPQDAHGPAPADGLTAAYYADRTAGVVPVCSAQLRAGAQCRIPCNPGFTAFGPPATCSETSALTPQTCEPDCNLVALIPHIDPLAPASCGATLARGQQCTFQCAADHVRVGNNQITCGAGAALQGAAGRCDADCIVTNIADEYARGAGRTNKGMNAGLSECQRSMGRNTRCTRRCRWGLPVNAPNGDAFTTCTVDGVLISQTCPPQPPLLLESESDSDSENTNNYSRVEAEKVVKTPAQRFAARTHNKESHRGQLEPLQM